MRDHSRQLALSLVLGFGSIATAIIAPSGHAGRLDRGDGDRQHDHHL